MSDEALEFRLKTDERLTSLETGLKENTASTKRVESNTKELLEAWEAIKGGMKVLEFIGRIAKPITAVSVFLATVWAMWPGKK